MKLTETKINKIQIIFEKFREYCFHHLSNDNMIQKALDKIVEVHDNKKVRSLPEQGLYWSLMAWCERNTPVWIAQLMDMENITSNGWHSLCKSKMKVTSTAFDSMPENEFNEYFRSIQGWLSQFIFRCSQEDMMSQVMNERIK